MSCVCAANAWPASGVRGRMQLARPAFWSRTTAGHARTVQNDRAEPPERCRGRVRTRQKEQVHSYDARARRTAASQIRPAFEWGALGPAERAQPIPGDPGRACPALQPLGLLRRRDDPEQSGFDTGISHFQERCLSPGRLGVGWYRISSCFYCTSSTHAGWQTVPCGDYPRYSP